MSDKAPGGKAANTDIEINQIMFLKVRQTNMELFLDQLQFDVTGTIMVMIGRKWDVSVVIGRYLSTNFVVSDAKKGVEFPIVWGRKYKKGATRKRAQWWCDACNTTIDCPVPRYRMVLDVSDDTEHIAVVLFDEPASALISDDGGSLLAAISNIIGTAHVLEIKSHTYYEYDTFKSFTYWKIDPTEGIKESIGSSTLDANAGSYTPKLKRLRQNLSVPTPLKPSEEVKKIRVDIKNSDTEYWGDSGEGDIKGKVARVSDKGEKMIEDSDAEVSSGSAKDGRKNKASSHSDKKKGDVENQDPDAEVSCVSAQNGSKKKPGRHFDKKKQGDMYLMRGRSPGLGSWMHMLWHITCSVHSFNNYNLRQEFSKHISCHAIMWYEERNGKAKRAVNLTFSNCCQEGKVVLLRFNETPPPLKKLLDYSDGTTSRFKDQLRVSNGAKDQPIVEPSQHLEWFSQQKKPPTPDRDWNKTLPATHELLVGPTYELMKGSCKSLVELKFYLEEVYKAMTDQLDWVNPESQQYPHNLLKPLPLIPNSRGHHVIPFDHFINNNLEYLRGGASSRKYTTSVTKTKAADYGHIKIIAVTELKIVEWHNYKHLEWITVRRDDDKLYKFKEGDFKRLCIQDIEDMLLLLVQGKLTNLTVKERFAFNVSLRMFTRSIVIQRRVEDLQLYVEIYQKKLNLTKPETYRSDLKRKEAYIAYSNLRGFIYQNKDKQNKLMRIDELHKFSDGTLTDVRTALDDRLKGIRMKYLPQTI
nr:nucleic acid-binding, OB-fold protein [Tanacetum cinerariifolium]